MNLGLLTSDADGMFIHLCSTTDVLRTLLCMCGQNKQNENKGENHKKKQSTVQKLGTPYFAVMKGICI